MKLDEIKILSDFLIFQKENYPQEAALADPIGKGSEKVWKELSTETIIELSYKLSAFLLEKGIKKGDKVGIIGANCSNWMIIDRAVIQIGAVLVPIYPTINMLDLSYILAHSDISLIFTLGSETYNSVWQCSERMDSSPEIIRVEEPEFESIMNEEDNTESIEKIKAYRDEIDSNDLATVLFTSGTEGNPKGVMLSHKNIISNVISCLPLLPVDSGSRALSFLPLNHIFERMITYLYMVGGVSIYYAESSDTIGEDLKLVKPHVFTVVPRLIERVYDRIMEKAAKLSFITKPLFNWAISLDEEYEYANKSFKYNIRLKVARMLVFKKWRKALGGRVKCLVSGSAALDARLNRIFTAAGIDILEGYGLTETSPVVSVNRYDKSMRYFGTVGPLLNSVRVKISEEENEILVKGPNVMLGYYKNAEATQAKLTSDGWFKTGDIGEWVEDKYLKITDRIDSVFKTSVGKMIIPQSLEKIFKNDDLMEHFLICGKNEKFVSALIIQNGKQKEERVRRIKEWIENKNRELSDYQKVRAFVLLEDNWSIESGEITPTLKLKRNYILKKYQQTVKKIYESNAEEGGVYYI